MEKLVTLEDTSVKPSPYWWIITNSLFSSLFDSVDGHPNCGLTRHASDTTFTADQLNDTIIRLGETINPGDMDVSIDLIFSSIDLLTDPNHRLTLQTLRISSIHLAMARSCST